MKKALIIHGTLGNPSVNWFPWLKKELEALGVKTFVPQLPTPEGQTIENYLMIMDNTIGNFDQDTLLIGHSSGVLAICAKLQLLALPIQAAFLVAPFLGDIGNAEYDQYNHAFNVYPYDWNKVKTGASRFYIYRGDNDPYVPAENGIIISEKLGVLETIIPGGGHLSATSGFTTFPQILSDIKLELAR